MARNLLRSDVQVSVWNRSPEKARPLAEDGARLADDPVEAAKGASFLITMLADAPAMEEILEASGALSALDEGAVWLQMSTVGISDNERLAQVAARHGIVFVDAPVIGTKQPAERGQLTILASGPDEARERCAPIFDALGNQTVWLGPSGNGTRLKLVVNNWITGLLGVLAETIAFAESLEVPPTRFLEAIEGRPLNAPYAQSKGKMMLQEDFTTSFSLALASKDVDLILAAAASHGMHMPLAEVVADRFLKALEAGFAERDMAAIYEAYKANPV